MEERLGYVFLPSGKFIVVLLPLTNLRFAAAAALPCHARHAVLAHVRLQPMIAAMASRSADWSRVAS